VGNVGERENSHLETKLRGGGSLGTLGNTYRFKSSPPDLSEIATRKDSQPQEWVCGPVDKADVGRETGRPERYETTQIETD
jgi:hypothetical protein